MNNVSQDSMDFGFLGGHQFSKAVLRIRDVYPGSGILILPFPDPGSNNNTKTEGGNTFVVLAFFVRSHKYHKIVNNFILEQVKTFF
jgi:hypothetical protein